MTLKTLLDIAISIHTVSCVKDFKRCLDLSLLSSFKLCAESVVKIFLPFLFYFGLTMFGSF